MRGILQKWLKLDLARANCRTASAQKKKSAKIDRFLCPTDKNVIFKNGRKNRKKGCCHSTQKRRFVNGISHAYCA